MTVPMFLFNDHENGQNNRDFPSAGGTPITNVPRKRSLFEVLTGEERRLSIGSLLFILVLSLHLWGAFWLLQPTEPITMAQPLMMEVSLVSAPGLKPTIEPPAPPKRVDPIHPKQKTVSKPVKKLQKKKKPAQKQEKLPKPKLAAEELLPAPSLTEAFDNVSEAASNTVASDTARQSASSTKGSAEPYSEASFKANYGTNPKPKYPNAARSWGWQGTVLLRVSVSAEGLSESVTVHRSSGHDVLDESAVAAVEKWQFIPAKRGNTTVACSVIVPIIFTLNP